MLTSPILLFTKSIQLVNELYKNVQATRNIWFDIIVQHLVVQNLNAKNAWKYKK